MIIQTFKLIIDKTSKNLAKETLKNQNNIKEAIRSIRSIVRNPKFKDFSLALSTGTTLGGLILHVFINDTRSLNSQNEAVVEELSTKIIEDLRNQGLISQEGDIKTERIKSSNNSSNEIVQKNMGINKIHYPNERIGFLTVIGILLLFVFRPTKALEIVESITNDN